MNVARLNVVLEAAEPARLPRFKGSVVRGGFGLAFRRVACPFSGRECAGCLLRRQCVWSCVFNTPRPEDSVLMPKSETVPHPFVIELPEDGQTRLEPGQELAFGLTLVGRAVLHVPYFILAFEQMAEQGLGAGRAKFRVKAVHQNGTSFYDPESKTLRTPLQTTELSCCPGASAGSLRLTVRFLTPTRIIYQDRMSRRPQFHVLMRSLLRRIWLLSYFHDQPLELDQKALIAAAEGVALADAVMAGADWRHYSTRQLRKVEREGMTGWVRYEGELGPFLPFLKAGEVLHVGKGTSFGMGKYRMEMG